MLLGAPDNAGSARLLQGLALGRSILLLYNTADQVSALHRLDGTGSSPILGYCIYRAGCPWGHGPR